MIHASLRITNRSIRRPSGIGQAGSAAFGNLGACGGVFGVWGGADRSVEVDRYAERWIVKFFHHTIKAVRDDNKRFIFP
jgi:hypothetical protein